MNDRIRFVIHGTTSFSKYELQAWSRQFHQFNQPGIKRRQFSINGFVAGHSRLSYLRQFPIDTLKIDQLFVYDIVTATGDATILSGLNVLGNRLKTQVDARHVVVSADRAQSGSS